MLQFKRSHARGKIGFYVIKSAKGEITLFIEHKTDGLYYTSEVLKDIETAMELANDIDSGKVQVEFEDLSKEFKEAEKANDKWTEETFTPEFIKKQKKEIDEFFGSAQIVATGSDKENFQKKINKVLKEA